MNAKHQPGLSPDPCDAGRCFLCRNCLPEWKSAIAAARQVHTYKKGHVIYREGMDVRGLYFIIDGAVKVHQSWGKDKEIILRFAAAGDVLGHRGQGGAAIFPVSATTLEPTRLCFIPNNFLETTFKTNPSFLYAMMQLYAAELQKAERRMRSLALTPVKAGVAEALFAIGDIFGVDSEGFVRVPVTRSDIASYAGTTYEAVFRLLTEWTAAGLVSTLGKYIRINDRQRLAHNCTG
jgi:CRP-like cAMP-binding protein